MDDVLIQTWIVHNTFSFLFYTLYTCDILMSILHTFILYLVYYQISSPSHITYLSARKTIDLTMQVSAEMHRIILWASSFPPFWYWMVDDIGPSSRMQDLSNLLQTLNSVHCKCSNALVWHQDIHILPPS